MMIHEKHIFRFSLIDFYFQISSFLFYKCFGKSANFPFFSFEFSSFKSVSNCVEFFFQFSFSKKCKKRNEAGPGGRFAHTRGQQKFADDSSAELLLSQSRRTGELLASHFHSRQELSLSFAFQHMFLNVFLMYHLEITFFPSQNVSTTSLLNHLINQKRIKKSRTKISLCLLFLIRGAFFALVKICKLIKEK
jgi:hypothetical protein